jgi:serine/threonine-protein kinase
LTPDDPHGEAAGSAPFAAGAPASAAAAPPAVEGRLIAGRYRVERRLGNGGMAEVFLARDATLGRLVAVKVLHERFADDEQFVARFHREARAAAALNHPNVVAVHDRGVSAGSSYIVMEYVPGETLRELVRRAGRLSPAAARAIELDLLAALQAAHEGGIVHRDVTAQNVLLTEDGRVKVTDFGIARFGSSTLTSAGVVMGTSRYLSPEQARGEPTDVRSDLYSAGVVLFEMLTGRPPFEGNNDVAIALCHANEPAPAPTALVPDLPAGLDALVSRALRKDPAQRFQTAREFAGALTALDPVAGGGDTAAGDARGSEAAETAATLVAPAGARNATGIRRPRRRLLTMLAALFALAVMFAGVLVYRTYVDPAVAMPSVVGMKEGRGASALRSEGFSVRSTGGYSDAYAPGVVMAQRPAAGASVKKGLRVHVVVSRGLLHPAVLSVVGETSSGATAALRAQSFVPKGLSEHSSGVPPGEVVRQSPAAGTTLLRGGSVRYWVSSGPPMVPVPDVVGASEGSATDTLRAAGFSVAVATSGHGDGFPGTAVGQEPSAGSSALQGSQVTIWLASLKHQGPPGAHGGEGSAGGDEGNAH